MAVEAVTFRESTLSQNENPQFPAEDTRRVAEKSDGDEGVAVLLSKLCFVSKIDRREFSPTVKDGKAVANKVERTGQPNSVAFFLARENALQISTKF